MGKLIQKLWNNYNEITPSVKKIKSILNLNDDYMFTDHIAFRSINTNNFGIWDICKPFMDIGYRIKNSYYFKEKKLSAIHLENNLLKNSPKIFISELLLDQCSVFVRNQLLNSFNYIDYKNKNILTSGRNWNVYYDTYKQLEKESEYAAWLYVHGIRVNHFTLDVNKLKKYTIESLCNKLRCLGINLNEIGGVIKGDKSKGLKQASTIADTIYVEFEDLYHKVKIPSCYVEFAERHLIKNNYFNGFLVKSANKIFESTNRITV